ncbi:DUF885 domain-containing protein [Tahibacter harae]|uniref:DUF885 domain-containing protein n=1 Tax=Tahibacter harae TaxID=2963937 RepID=A0ABT1QYT9_9GAMM|nr:DUF885 domain-containing protein [Tahibacter harae]MCQ4167420.1 DUF885 domain-containing protein [Tahibacter harae]
MTRSRRSYPIRALIAALGAALFGAACTPAVRQEAATPPAAAAAPVVVPDPVAELNALADRYVDAVLDFDPTVTYFTGLPVKAHDRLPRNSAADIAALEQQEDAMLAELDRIAAAPLQGTPHAVTYAILRESLESSRDLRICHRERWTVSHMNGWLSGLAEAAQAQPVATAQERSDAVARWSGLGAFIDNDIANQRNGLATGYSAPRSVVDRVLKQLDGMLAGKPEALPFYSPAERSDDAAFKAQMRQVMLDKVQPALQRYRDFLAKEYRAKARESVALSALPDGAACYAAQLRSYTTLKRSPREVYELGQKTVADNEAVVAELGQRLFGTRDIPTIIKKVEKEKKNLFKSEQELLDYSRAGLDRARELSAPLFARMPKQPAVIEPFPEFQRGSGVSSHYIPSTDPAKPGEFRIQLENWRTETRGAAEITLVHETWPGHHLQIALANELPPSHRIVKLGFNSAYLEGWGRYSERLAEEAGIYQTEYARISRRIWPARGMVGDPGLHLFGWTRQQAIDYFAATGRFGRKGAEDLIDRIAVMPAQLTSYDSGGLEIFALREQAERELGAKFDIRQFHSQVIDQGVVPLALLRQNVERWIAQTK